MFSLYVVTFTLIFYQKVLSPLLNTPKKNFWPKPGARIYRQTLLSFSTVLRLLHFYMSLAKTQMCGFNNFIMCSLMHWKSKKWSAAVDMQYLRILRTFQRCHSEFTGIQQLLKFRFFLNVVQCSSERTRFIFSLTHIHAPRPILQW